MTRLSRRTVLVLAALAWTAFSAATWFEAESNADRLEQQAAAAMTARADVAAEAIEQTLLRTLEAVADLHDLAQARQRLLEAGNAGGVKAIEAHLSEVAQRGRFGVLQVAVIGANGRLEWSSVPDSGHMDLSDREHFRVHRDGMRGLFVSAPLVGRASGQWSVQLTRALLSGTGQFAGVAVVSIDPVELSHQLRDLRFGEDGGALVMRADGVILARSRNIQTSLGKSFPSDWPLIRAMRVEPNGHLYLEKSQFEGRPTLIAYRQIEDSPLAISIGLDAEREMAPTQFVRPALRAASAGISGLALAVICLGVLWFERRRTYAALDRAREDREAALQRLAQGQRMEALGSLAGGIAHDFNNALQAIIGAARVIQLQSDDVNVVRRFVALIERAADRGASVTRRLLAFARKGELRAERIELSPLLDGLREVLTHTLGPSVRVQSRVADELPVVLADRGQLETVLVNLAVNARDAMAADGGGTVVFSAYPTRVEEGDEVEEPRLDPGCYVCLEVSDTGQGMDPETLSRAAEPFFTTKPRGEGTGLGLAMAKGFAEQSGGALSISSVLEQGTTVALWLPCVEAAAPAVPQDADTHAPAPGPAIPGRILLVDDEEVVRDPLVARLTELGHQVEDAQDGETALARLHQGLTIDVLITDLSMPGMTGLELVRLARKLQPGLPAMLITGSAGVVKTDALGGDDQGPIVILRKPFRPGELAGGVAAILRSRQARTAAAPADRNAFADTPDD